MLTKPPSYDTCLLYLWIDRDLGTIPAAVRHAVNQTTKRLIVVLASPEFDSTGHESLVSKWDLVQNLLVLAYVPAAQSAQARDDPLFSTDVILVPSASKAAQQLSEEKWDAVLTLDGVLPPKELVDPSHRTATLPSTTEQADDIQAPPPTEHANASRGSYPVTAIGGTFDYLHPGHKILLSMSAWITTSKLIVGVTDDSLLVKKANRQYIQSISSRTASVCAFVKVFKPSIECDAVPIEDVYGPTAWDPNIQALVSLTRHSAVAQIRSEKSLPPLDLFVIDVISSSSVMLPEHDTAALRKDKLSSTHIREWLARRDEAPKQ
ncbi:cytidylyltransferase domain-containing protein [Ceratobasidium sp. AG-Ba]|nr:cytidylyltransferase domain-containing protein [Ceratobasidium sp. AG-Ba]QRW14366.1 cytidylyltransferase domain-containing protein [Ceratobasidium sp. AG-Ba]